MLGRARAKKTGKVHFFPTRLTLTAVALARFADFTSFPWFSHFPFLPTCFADPCRVPSSSPSSLAVEGEDRRPLGVFPTRCQHTPFSFSTEYFF